MADHKSSNRFSRTEQLIGTKGMTTLRRARVAIAGLGGVGSFVVEALARAGIGWLILIDFDEIDLTNTNRQIHALEGNYGRAKVEIMAERVKAINPDCIVITWKEFVRKDNLPHLLHGALSYVVDAIDTVSSKIALIEYTINRGIPIISAMGAGNKLDPLAFQVDDISKTHTCPLAKAVRKGLREKGITHGVKAVFSTEPAVTNGTKPLPDENNQGCKECNCPLKRPVPGSISYVPPIVGLIIAGEIIRDLLKKD